MGDRVRFVDKLNALPTVLLNLNDEATWWVRSFDAPPPRKRRSVATNAMRDGGYVSSSTYDMRVLTLTLDMRKTTQDDAATELQKLARILDKPSILEYKPDTATSPVFFKVYPSDLAAVVDMYASTAYRQLTIELLAEPFAVGIRTSISAGTVVNTSPYFDIASASIAGDVPTPFWLVDGTPSPSTTTGASYKYNWLLASTTEEAASQPTIIQCESLTLGADMTVSGSNARHTPTGTGSALRMTYSTTGATARALRGSFRLYVTVTGTSGTTSATASVTAKYGSASAADLSTGVTATTPSFSPTGTQRVLLDLGTVNFDAPASVDPSPRIEISTSCSTTTGPPTVDYDFLILVPLDEAAMTAEFLSSTAGGPGGRRWVARWLLTVIRMPFTRQTTRSSICRRRCTIGLFP
jgi:hypothetical protein